MHCREISLTVYRLVLMVVEHSRRRLLMCNVAADKLNDAVAGENTPSPSAQASPAFKTFRAMT
jgi:hypothetical protein